MSGLEIPTARLVALKMRQRWAEPVYTPGFRIREQRDVRL